MKRNNPIWIAAFAALAVLGVVLFFTAAPLILKLLFLLIAIGAAVYCWLLIESRRIAPKTVEKDSLPGPVPEAPPAESEEETPEMMEAGEDEGESPRPGGQDGRLVFVSEKGDKYHLDRECVGLRFADNVESMPEEQAATLNRKPCSKCRPKAKEE